MHEDENAALAASTKAVVNVAVFLQKILIYIHVSEKTRVV
jgi:hypothetical protein